MKECKGFFCTIFMLFIALMLVEVNKKYGILFDDNFKQIFNIAIPVGAEIIFIFIYSFIEKIVSKNN